MFPSLARPLALLLAALPLWLVPTAVRAQQVGLAAHAGTLGLGADVAVRVAPRVELRAGANYFPFDITVDEDSIEYTFDLPSPQFLLLADYYPTSFFRLTGGVMISANDLGLEAELAEPVEIGNTTYTPEQVGRLTGSLDARTVALYTGIGFGAPTERRVGFFLDLGLAWHGNPEISATAHGPIASDPGFRADLEAEVDERQEDVDDFIAYPVFSIGLSFRLR